MCAASKKSKTQQLKERWQDGELDCGAITPEFIKALSPRELGMLGELITIDYFNERGYTLQTAQAVDLFPRCAHVETVALLQKV